MSAFTDAGLHVSFKSFALVGGKERERVHFRAVCQIVMATWEKRRRREKKKEKASIPKKKNYAMLFVDWVR